MHTFIDIEDSCTSLMFCNGLLLTSLKKYYVVDPVTQTLDLFLDPSDKSLAFYSFAAVQRQVYPLAMVFLTDTEEILLCYSEMGVFVNKKGGRSRPHEIRWGRTPLSFQYQSPFLYVSHFNCIQMIEVSPEMCTNEYTEPPRYAEMISNSACIGIIPGAAIATVTRSNSSEIIALSGKICPKMAFTEAATPSVGESNTSMESHLEHLSNMNSTANFDEELTSSHGPDSPPIQRSMSMADYFRSPVGGNTSMTSSLLEDMNLGDDWDSRSELARL